MGEDEDEQYECQIEGCDEVWDSSRSRGIHLSSHSDAQIKSAMLRDITQVAEKIDDTPRLEDMNSHGEFSSTGIRKKFGTWSDALSEAGFGRSRRSEKRISEKQLIDEMCKLKDKNGSPPTLHQMNGEGKFSAQTYVSRFGSWNGAIEASGLSANTQQKTNKETLVRELRRLANELGRTPMSTDMIEHGQYSAALYSRRFEGWEEALHSAGLEVDYFDYNYDDVNYGPDWRKDRDIPLSRDDNQCRVCSDISQVISGDQIHVHHITPVGEFGVFDSGIDVDYEVMNHPSNLITLCVSCHQEFEGNWTEATPDEFARYAKAELKAEIGSTSSEASHEIASD